MFLHGAARRHEDCAGAADGPALVIAVVSGVLGQSLNGFHYWHVATLSRISQSWLTPPRLKRKQSVASDESLSERTHNPYRKRIR